MELSLALLIINLLGAYKMKAFLEVSPESDFSLANLPFGVFHLKTQSPANARCATRLGDFVIDLAFLEQKKALVVEEDMHLFDRPTLNDFIERGKEVWARVRADLRRIFAAGSEFAVTFKCQAIEFVYPIDQVQMLLPVKIGDYTDFYSSRDHAYNVGVMFRGPENALQPNWLWLPVGYHGRASSIVASPASFPRPSGQTKGPNDDKPKFEKSKKMDFELEVGAIVGKSNKLGEPIDIKKAQEHIFGFVLLNDVSARDIQNWEYVPLGPFTAKNLVTVISPWIVTAEALKGAFQKLPPQDPAPLEYLADPNYGSYDVVLDVTLRPENSPKEHLLSRSNMKYLYWSFSQQLTHHTVTGCNMAVGDVLGSGTISGKDRKEAGSLLELSWNGKEPLTLDEGIQRTFWEDGDTVVLKGHAIIEGQRVGFGDCITKMTK
jgi:fumarylacetoacetase